MIWFITESVPDSKRDFYITNDHYFAGGLFRDLEVSYGPWSWATHVQYCDASGEVSLEHVLVDYDQN